MRGINLGAFFFQKNLNLVSSKGISFLTLWFVFLVTGIFFSCQIPVFAQKISVDGGYGTVQFKGKTDQIVSNADSNLRYLRIGLKMAKKGHPINVSFQGVTFSTMEDKETWNMPSSQEIFQENNLKSHGTSFDLLIGYNPFTYGSSLAFSPYIGGGLIYKRMGLKRVNTFEKTIPLNNQYSGRYFFSDQDILTIGGKSFLGAWLKIPDLGIEVNLDVGWALFSSKNKSDYYISLWEDEGTYPQMIYSSGYSLTNKISISKVWEFITVGIGFEWEKTIINEKNIQFYELGTTQFPLPSPRLEISKKLTYLHIGYIF